MKRRTLALSALALATMTSLALAADPIKIGLSGPLTGGSSSMGYFQPGKLL